MGTFFLVALAVPRRGAAQRRRAPCTRAGLGGAGAGRWPRSPASSRSLHDVPHPPGRALGRHLHRPEYWLGQHGVGRGGEPWQLLRRRAVRRSSGRRCCSARSARSSLFRRPTLLRAVPGLGLRALAGRLLVGGREVRLAGAAPAAAADPARRRRRAGDLGRRAARWSARSASRSRRSRSLYVGLRLVRGSTPTTAPTRASCSSPRSPRPRSSRSPTRSLALADSRGPGKPPLTVTVDSAEGATFPYAWYFRHLDVGYIDLSQPNAAPPDRRDVIVLTAGRQHAACSRRADRLRRRASSRSASGGCATTARSRPGNLVRAGSPSASCGTRPAGCRSGSTSSRRLSARSPDRRAVAVEHACAPSWSHLARPGVAVGRRARSGRRRRSDAVAVDQRARRGGVGGRVERLDVVAARCPGRAPTAARGRPSRSRSGGR